MLGGHLNFNSISLLSHHLITTFGNLFYIFNTTSHLCVSVIDLGHQAHVLSFVIEQQKQNYNVSSIDIDGLLIKAKFIIHGDSSQQNYQGGIEYKVQSKKQIIPKKQKSKLISAVFVGHNEIVVIDGHKKLYHYSFTHNSYNPISQEHTFSRLINKQSDAYIFAIQTDEKNMRIYNKQNLSVFRDYTHSSKITSAISVEQILVIGDEKGKITLFYDYFTQKKNKKQKFESVLEWHTGPVLTLCSHGQYVYSAGEQSTIVLWHIRDLSRDFLPRVRTAIHYLQIKTQTNEIICGLADNTIKVIDLSRDKETQSYKTIVNPKGYAPSESHSFSIYTTHYRYGLVCLNSLPGKLQFINLFKNGENTQLEIVPRNLINSINEDIMKPHRINSFAFSRDSTSLAISILVQPSKSYLKFYRKGVQGYDLISKIQNPHIGQVQACLNSSNKKHNKIMSYSLSDKVVRVWSQFVQKKKSIVDIDEIYWKCEQELKFRNLYPTFVSKSLNYILTVYNNTEIVIYENQQDGTVAEIQTISMGEVKQVQLIEYSHQKQKISIKLLVLRNQFDIELWAGHKNKNQALQLKNTERIHAKQKITSYFVADGEDEAAAVFTSNKKSKLIILNKKQGKFISSYDCDEEIESAFWMEKRLIILGSDLTMSSLDNKQFVTFQSPLSGELHHMQDESTEIRIASETDLFRLNERWVERESVKSKKKIEDSIQGLHLLPNCTYAWQQMSTRILI